MISVAGIRSKGQVNMVLMLDITMYSNASA